MAAVEVFKTESERWRALQCRNRAAHSSFVYAVTTTRIYCRPTCPSRLARRANVQFFDNAAKAIIAGFRACKRCKPEVTTTKDHTMVMINQACRVIEAGLGDVSMADAARAAGVTTRHLHTLFKGRLGCTPAEYARDVKWQSEQMRGAAIELGLEGIPPLPELTNYDYWPFDSTDSSPETMSPFAGQDSVPTSSDHLCFWHDDFFDPSLDLYPR